MIGIFFWPGIKYFLIKQSIFLSHTPLINTEIKKKYFSPYFQFGLLIKNNLSAIKITDNCKISLKNSNQD